MCIRDRLAPPHAHDASRRRHVFHACPIALCAVAGDGVSRHRPTSGGRGSAAAVARLLRRGGGGKGRGTPPCARDRQTRGMK
eukprot:3512212-Prymnesium_polylepis.1